MRISARCCFATDPQELSGMCVFSSALCFAALRKGLIGYRDASATVLVGARWDMYARVWYVLCMSTICAAWYSYLRTISQLDSFPDLWWELLVLDSCYGFKQAPTRLKSLWAATFVLHAFAWAFISAASFHSVFKALSRCCTAPSPCAEGNNRLSF